VVGHVVDELANLLLPRHEAPPHVKPVTQVLAHPPLDEVQDVGHCRLQTSDIRGQVTLPQSDIRGGITLPTSDIRGQVTLPQSDIRGGITLPTSDIRGQVTLLSYRQQT